MQLILMEKVDNLGSLGDIVNVKAGYARNFLLPQHKAKVATPESIKEFEEHRAELERLAAEKLGGAEGRKALIDGMSVTIAARTGNEGKLFGSVGPAEIAGALEAAGATVEKREIRLPEGPLRVVGEHSVEIHLHADVNATITVVIVGEEV